jgi:hypothetical protein
MNMTEEQARGEGMYLKEVETLERIDAQIALLSPDDTEGHVWWNRFRKFISGEEKPIDLTDDLPF